MECGVSVCDAERPARGFTVTPALSGGFLVSRARKATPLWVQRCAGTGFGHAIPSLNLSPAIKPERRRLQSLARTEGIFMPGLGGEAELHPSRLLPLEPISWRGHKKPQHQTHLKN